MTEEVMMEKQEVLKVSSKSSPNSVAGAIAGVLENKETVSIKVIGAGALNQSVKAIAIAQGFLAPHGVRLAFTPSFFNVFIKQEEKTGIELLILKKK